MCAARRRPSPAARTRPCCTESRAAQARRPVWRSSRCSVTSRLHLRIVTSRPLRRVCLVTVLWSCALMAVRCSSRAGRPLCCQPSAARSRGNLEVVLLGQFALRQLHSFASAIRSRLFLGHGMYSSSRTASQPSRLHVSMPRPQKRRQPPQGIDVITVFCHARGDRYLDRRRATRRRLPKCLGERGCGWLRIHH